MQMPASCCAGIQCLNFLSETRTAGHQRRLQVMPLLFVAASSDANTPLEHHLLGIHFKISMLFRHVAFGAVQLLCSYQGTAAQIFVHKSHPRALFSPFHKIINP